jgi:hypothetical protein
VLEEEWVEARVVDVVVDVVVPARVREETAFALPVAKKYHTRQAHPAMTGSAPNAAHP